MLGCAAFSAFPTGLAAGRTMEMLPDLGAAETVPLWPALPPGGEEPDLRLRIIERSFEPGRFQSRALTGIDRPALCVFPSLSPNGTALLVMPGGGYRGVT